jgi:GNAT superfamily N-acetyltransferase
MNNNIAKGKFAIRQYRPGDLGYIEFMHCKSYTKEYGLDGESFEQYVMASIAEFLNKMDRQGSMVWIAEHLDQIIGAIAIIKSDFECGQVRWFLVDPHYRGLGLGKELLSTAINFCRSQNYKRVFLLTISILPAARHLYQQYGFELREEKTHLVWGKDLTEERWELKLQ